MLIIVLGLGFSNTSPPFLHCFLNIINVFCSLSGGGYLPFQEVILDIIMSLQVVAVHGIKWGATHCSMNAITIGKLCQWQQFCPIVLFLRAVASQVMLK